MRRLTKKITSIVLLASFTASLSSMALAADVGTVTDDCVRLRRESQHQLRLSGYAGQR